jgi:hypothetical protein
MGKPALIVVHCGKTLLSQPRVILMEDLPQEKGPRNQPTRSVFGRDFLRERGLFDSDISRRQFALWGRGDGSGHQVFLKDLGSKNGTHVDGFRLPASKGLHAPAEPEDDDLRFKAELRDGAILRCGSTLMVFREHMVPPYEPALPCFEHRGEKMVGPFGLHGLQASVERLGAVNKNNPGLGRLNVLLEAKTGAGKELLARYIACTLGRAQPFVAVNAPSIVSTLFGSEFFGIGKNALTGVNESPGLVGQASKGTLFIDEIHELPRSEQAQLLRFLQDRDYIRVGDPRELRADVMVVAATSQPIEARAERDIFTRLGQVSLALPALAERAEDIPEICRELLRRRGMKESEIAALPVEVEMMEALLLHDWRGNIRELRNELEAALGRTQGTSTPGLRLWALEGLLDTTSPDAPRSLTLARIQAAMDRCKQKQTEAADLLRIDRSKLQRWLRSDS